MSHDLDGENDPTSYSYKPSLFGAPWQFRLAVGSFSPSRSWLMTSV